MKEKLGKITCKMCTLVYACYNERCNFENLQMRSSHPPSVFIFNSKTPLFNENQSVFFWNTKVMHEFMWASATSIEPWFAQAAFSPLKEAVCLSFVSLLLSPIVSGTDRPDQTSRTQTQDEDRENRKAFY